MSNKSRDRIRLYQNISFYIFVPVTGIAIFSDNGMFELLSLISGIVFGTLIFIEYQV